MAITIHLGTYKTATTSLQRLLKDNKDHLRSLGYDIYAGTFDRDYKTMRNIHSYLNGQQSKKEFMSNFDGLFLSGSNNNKIISEEMVLGALHKGPALYGDNINKLLSALDDINIPYKIVFVTRRIDALLESLYAHNLAVGYTKKSFVNFYENLDFGMCHWSRVLNEFEAGKNLTEISVLPFEMCSSDPNVYIEHVMTALGLPRLDWGELPRENRSIGKKGFSVVKFLNENKALDDEDKKHLVKMVYKYFTKESDSKVDFLGKYRKVLVDYYRADNDEIAKKYFQSIPSHYYQNMFW